MFDIKLLIQQQDTFFKKLELTDVKKENNTYSPNDKRS
jgi:hypothetical protein